MQTLKQILSDLHPDVDFDIQTGLVDNGILDSFDIVTIVAEIDGEWDIAIPAEELTPENFDSLGALWALVKRLEDK